MTWTHWITGRVRQMRFNADTCTVLHRGRKNPGYEYKMGATTLEPVTEENDLGVIIAAKLKCDRHTEAQKLI